MRLVQFAFYPFAPSSSKGSWCAIKASTGSARTEIEIGFASMEGDLPTGVDWRYEEHLDHYTARGLTTNATSSTSLT